MKTPPALTALIAWLLLAACGASSTGPSPGAAAPAPTTAPAAIATSAPTVPPPAPTAKPAVRAVTFSAAGDVTLAGTLYGEGTTAVVLSNMGDNDPGAWDKFAPMLAARGYSVLTYKFRYPTNSATFDSGMANNTLDDLRAAVAFVRSRGAQKLVLVGASLGGMATAKAAAVEKPAAMAILAAPVDLSEYGFRVEHSALQAIDATKHFMGSKDDK